jgi:hypothetical protein
MKVAVLAVMMVALLGISLHAAGVEVGGEPFLCAICPFC